MIDRDWRGFARRENPAASALMAKMKIASGDRARVKLECVRLLSTLRLNEAKMHLILGFVDGRCSAGFLQARRPCRMAAIAIARVPAIVPTSPSAKLPEARPNGWASSKKTRTL